ncbi:NFX1-type zinc finger-containing protein 1 [Mactra antiquata]
MAKYIVFGNTKIEPPKYLRALEQTTYNLGFLKPHKDITYTIPFRQQLCDHMQDNVDQLQNIQQYSDPTVVKLEEISNANTEVEMEWTDTSSSAGKVEEKRKNKLQLSHYVGLSNVSNDESNITNGVEENGTDIVLNMRYKLLSDHTTAQSNKGANVIDEHSTNYSDIVWSELKLTDYATDISKEESTSDYKKSVDIKNTLQNKLPSYDQRHDLLENEFIDIDHPLILNTLQDEKEVLDDTKDQCEDKQIKEENQRMTFVEQLLDHCKDTSENDFEFTGQVDVLHGKWPSANELGLDSSQYDAFKAALTSAITLIQGPPGCGKTYVGLQIVKTLLKNKHVRHSGNPIMILCYTNHALDQFMTEICNFYQGTIVRVGSRISTEKLKSISLSNHRQEFRKEKRFPLPIYHAGRANRQVINDSEFTINLLSTEMDCLKRNIVCIESLKCVIESDFYKQFQWKMNTQHRRSIPPWLRYLGHDIIIEWLGIYDLAQEISNSTFRNTTNFQHLDDLTDESISCDHREVMTEKRFDVDENICSQHMKYRLKHLACDLDYIVSDIKYVPYHKKQMVRLERERLKKTIRLKLKSPFETSNETTDERITTDIFSEQFSREKRWTLYKKWVDKKCDSLMNDLSKSYDKYMVAYKRKSEIAMLEDDFILKKADVIGMTTTGAARINNTLRENQPDIVIVEEAAEVLEGHIVSNLTAGCEHLILIGDHKQLKPKPEVYGLEIDYNLNLSLFERLINNGIACHALQVQHRMRPEISANLRHIYKDLQDHKSVKRYECIKGVKHNAFFINHSVMESKPDELSYVNDHEALFLVRLCKYLLLQGYDERNITILTTYKGQMFKIKREMLTANLNEVLVTVVDNYQGEENDIILLSFVRSNESNKVGFVAKDNRVCVALSRAKKGLYAIGNFEQLSNSSSLWNSVVNTMKNKGLYGDKLPLMCQNHNTDEGIYVQVHTDFDNAPEGGCMKSCDARLDCGHVCTRNCHISDRSHSQFICNKSCARTCDKNHPCKKRCHEKCYCEVVIKRIHPCGHDKYVKCGDKDDIISFKCEEVCRKKLPCGHTCLQKCIEDCKCTVMVQRLIPKCGHDVEVPCCANPNALQCNRFCERILPCGHPCRRRCRENCFPCLYNVKILRPDCGHLSSIQCDFAKNETQCMEQCGRTMTCGHKCKDVCSFKNEKNSTLRCPNGHNLECMELCDYRLKCGHRCMELCSTCKASGYHARCNKESKCYLICGHTAVTSCGYIKPCDRLCKRSCKHGRCEHICNCLCVPCKEPCSWQCEHYTCTKLCGEICDRPRCNLSCEKLLRCGHTCNGVCGDPCPVQCFECDHSSDNTMVVQLQDCGCILPITRMDQHMESGDSFFKTCPKCKTPILTTYGNRYEQLVNTGWKSMNALKANCKELYNAAQESFHVLTLWKYKHKVQIIFSQSWNVFRSVTSDNLYRETNLSDLSNSFNEFAICWFIKEMTDMKVFRSLEINTITTQGVEDIERYVRWCINQQTQTQLDKKITDLYESQRDASDNCSMVDKNESYTVMDQALESLFPTIGLTNYPGTVNIELSDNLPFLLIEECDIEDSSIHKTTDGLTFKYSPKQDVSRSDTKNSFLNNQIDVKEVVHSLVNAVCKHIGTDIDYPIPVRINDDFYIDSKSRGRIGAEKDDVQGNDEQEKQNEASGNASLTEVVCTQTNSTPEGSCKRIDIIECMKNGLKLTEYVPNVKETIASSRKSIKCTLYLMGNPWNKFIANDPESVNGTRYNPEGAQQTMDEEKQTASQENAKYSRHINSNQDPPNTLVHSYGELTSRRDSHNNELKSTDNKEINFQSETTTSFSLDDVNNAQLSKKRKIGENDPINNSMHKKWKEDGYASNVFNVKNGGGDVSSGNRQHRGQHRVEHSSKKYEHDNSMKHKLEKNDSCNNKRHSNKINWQDKGQFDHQSQYNDAKRSEHLYKSDHDYDSRQRRKYDDVQKHTRTTDKSHRDYGRHFSRQHGSHRDIRKSFKQDERRERDYDGKRKAGDIRDERHDKQDDDNEMERIINRRNDNANIYTDNKGHVDEPRFYHRGRKRKHSEELIDLAADNEIRDLREILVKKRHYKKNNNR